MLDLQSIRQTASQIAREAGKVQMRYFNNPSLKQTVKSIHTDIVTEADQAAEALIVPALHGAFPHHHIVGEEGSAVGTSPEEADYFWYIDPIDGTTNFANGIPYFSVSIALTDKHRQPLVGVVYNPVSNELFSAASGFGATLNDRPMRVTAKIDLSQCVVASGFPYHKATSEDNNLREWSTLLVRTRDLRRTGSAALDLCYVAAGRYDGYWEQSLNAWDFLAGVICVREAGGIVSDYTGNQEPEIFYRGRILASNSLIHEEMIRLLVRPE
jgi:myo-inositol-1(or 4)-monophosphatase